MERIFKKINTEIGYIGAKRNAIYVDSFKQEYNTLILIGEISSSCCDECFRDYRWYKYSLDIKGIKQYEAINIEDYYKRKVDTESSFSEVINLSNNDIDLRTIIIETYDWAYEVVCESFDFRIIDRR